MIPVVQSPGPLEQDQSSGLPPRRLVLYTRLVRLHRPVGILLLLWPTLWALWLAAGGAPPWPVLLLFLLGVVLTRSAGCAVNDYFDRPFDPRVRRTAQRPLATGQLRPFEALVLAAALFSVAFVLTWFLHPLVRVLAGVALFLAVTYPLAKRYFPLPQLQLGLAFSCSILLAYAAILGRLPGEAWLLFLANLSWTFAYDTYYAMCDREDDQLLGLRSSALWLGKRECLASAIAQILCLVLLCILGRHLELAWPFYVGLGAAALSFLHQGRLARTRDPEKCLRAFLNNRYSGALIYIGIFLALL